MTATNLPGVQERLYCVGGTAPPNPPPAPGGGGSVVCRTESQCDEARLREGIARFSSGEYPTRGCFRKKGKAFWGRGGSRKEVAEADLPGVQERLYCGGGDAGARSSASLAFALAESETVVSAAAPTSLGLSIVFVVAAFCSIG